MSTVILEYFNQTIFFFLKWLVTVCKLCSLIGSRIFFFKVENSSQTPIIVVEIAKDLE